MLIAALRHHVDEANLSPNGPGVALQPRTEGADDSCFIADHERTIMRDSTAGVVVETIGSASSDPDFAAALG